MSIKKENYDENSIAIILVFLNCFLLISTTINMRIELLPALNGDCILVEYYPKHFILIDGGYVDTYKNYLLPRLKEIAAHDGVLDLVVVTHIDCDHISGVIKLLEEEVSPIKIQSIWYNGYRHVQPITKEIKVEETFAHRNICKESTKTESKPISAKQGCTLSALIAQKGLAWNVPAGGGVIKVPMTIKVGNAVIYILSPNENNIENLVDFWRKRLIKDGLLLKEHSEEYWDDAFEFCMSRDKPGFRFHEKKVSKSYDLDKIKEEPYEPDNSATNGSSISFVLEADGKRILFLADAYAETVADSLNTLYGEENVPFRFDAVKMSHHGSFNNNSPMLLSRIACDKWFILTNGDKYNHPDLPTLAHVITHNNRCKLFFNYKLPVSEELGKPEYHEKYEFEVISSENGDVLSLTI